MDGVMLLTKETVEQYHQKDFQNERLNFQGNDKCEVKRIQSDISYDEFFRNFLIRNAPCLVTPATSGQTIVLDRDWVTQEGLPNWDFLDKKFGNYVVPVADCSEKYYNSQQKELVIFSQYLKYWRRLQASGHDYSNYPCLYLKDWHFVSQFPGERLYKVPVYFQSDWLNIFWDQRTDDEDDYRFVYMGPKGSWTPLHMDVFGSYSWSLNVCGRKRWLLFPPGADVHLRDAQGRLLYDATSEESPAQARQASKDYGLEVIQEAGQIMFVPSGWHHQVWNMEDTISINHNWFNGCSIDLVWHHLVFALKEVEEELQDCKDDPNWHPTNQLVLKAHHGMNYYEFLELLRTITNHAEKDLQKESHLHALFDLNRLELQLEIMTKHETIEECDMLPDVQSLSSRVKALLAGEK